MVSNQEGAEKLRDMAVNTGTLNCLGCGFEHNCSVHGCAVLKQAAELISQPNEPLTREQLREMDGEPVYWPKEKMWLVVYLNQPDFGDCALNREGQYLPLDKCERRKVYRRPPEGEE